MSICSLPDNDCEKLLCMVDVQFLWAHYICDKMLQFMMFLKVSNEGAVLTASNVLTLLPVLISEQVLQQNMAR